MIFVWFFGIAAFVVGVYCVYCFVMMCRDQNECDRKNHAQDWVNLVKRTRKKRAELKKAIERRPVESETWTIPS